ncbi:FAD-dependent oxidoreductase [Mariniluteicoccus flavus]
MVGGGIAGIAAATGLAERGVRVTLIEREDQLGGRVRAWPVEGEAPGGRTMSRGFHAFFRQYYTLRALLRRADPELSRLRPVDDYPLRLADGPTDSFAPLPRTPPWSILDFVRRSPTFPIRGLAQVHIPSALELVRVRFPETFTAHDGESAEAFLDRLRFPAGARHLALEVFARSFFAHPSEFSAGELIAMFHAYFTGSAEGLLFDVPDDDYDTALWAPQRANLKRLGVDVRTGESVTSIELDDAGITVHTEASRSPSDADPRWPSDPDPRWLSDEGVEATPPNDLRASASETRSDALVLATDPATTRALVAAMPDDGPADWPAWRDSVARIRSAPPFGVWRLWLDRPVADDRPAFLGTAAFGPLDNISVLERFEGGAARWRAQHGGSVVELHAYALDPTRNPAHADEEGVRAELWRQLVRAYPEVDGATVVAQEWLLQDDCGLVGLEPWASRPGVRTPDPRLVLAGDTIRCEHPVALMERAAVTGMQAANALLDGWGVAGHDLWTVPTTGLIPANVG